MPTIYQPRRPRASPLWQLLTAAWESFLATYEKKHRPTLGPLRPNVFTTVRNFLRCGDLAAGFLRFHCSDCGHECLLAFMVRPDTDMESTRNPFGRRPHPGSRIHLRKEHGRPACFPIRKTAAKRILGKAVWRATLETNEKRCEIFRISRLPAWTWIFSYRNTVH